MLPEPIVQMLRRLRATRSVQIARQTRALSAVAASPHPEPRGRTSIDLDAVFAMADGQEWQAAQERLRAFGLHHNRGGVNPGDRRVIFALAAYLKPRRVLEIGTHIGSSTVMLASALDGTDATITTVDISDVNDPQVRPWEQVGMAHSPAELVAGLAPVEFVVSDSVEYLTKNDGAYDLIFLDGDHTAPTVYRELRLALSKLSAGGMVLIHDYFPGARKLWPAGELIIGPALAVRRLQREGLQVRVLPLGELPWPTKLESNVTSLALALNGRGSS
jgi:predicted O-methyltransferase YrrM